MAPSQPAVRVEVPKILVVPCPFGAFLPELPDILMHSSRFTIRIG